MAGNEALLACSVCLDTLKEPVTIPCGHSYCRGCLEACWGRGGADTEPSCPQCRETFAPRPALVKSNVLALLVEELLRDEDAPGTAQGQEPVAESVPAQPGDVPCDVCVGQKVKALKSCLQCLASFCPEHLQPHTRAAPLKKHKLVEPLKSLQNNGCPEHNEVKKLFCHTDSQCICHICCWDKHQRHNVVYVSVARSQKQEKIKPSREKIQKTISSKRREEQELQQELLSIRRSADETVNENDRIFQKLAKRLEKQRVEINGRIRAVEKERVRPVEALQKQLLHEITELEKHDAQLGKISRVEDHNLFLETYTSLPQIHEYKESFQAPERPLDYFRDAALALAQLKDKLENVPRDEVENVLRSIQQPDVLLVDPQPQTRAEFLKYARNLTFDPQFANHDMILSNDNRRIEAKGGFSRSFLSKEILTQRCYFEVGAGQSIAVSYKQTPSSIASFGNNNSSWVLKSYSEPYTYSSGYKFYHNNTETKVGKTFTSSASSLGAFVDTRAGILAFYRIENDSMHLIHKVQTTFTQPLYAGVSTTYSASFLKLT